MRKHIRPILDLKIAALSRELSPGRRALALLLAFLLYTQAIVPLSLASSQKSALSDTNTGERLASRRAPELLTQSAPGTPAPETFGVVLTALNTPFNNHAGIDYHQQSRNLIVSANSPYGQPNNFELIDDGGTHHAFSNISNLGGALKIATARDDGQGTSLGGFRKGELFTGTSMPGVVARVAPDGSTVQNPWATLPGETGLPGGLHIDRTGVFGGDLIVVTTAGGVWRVNSAGVASQVATLNTPLAGVTTIPDDAARYGPWSGKILVGAKEQGAVYAVDAQGGATAYPLGVSPEEIEVVPAHENFFGLDPANGKLWGAPADAFSSLIGDVLVAQGSPGVLARVRWSGTKFETEQIAQVASWSQITFAPAGVAELRGVKQVYDKLAVVRHAPVLNSGRVEGALWQLSGENVSLSGNSVITSDLLVPGKPSVALSGHPSFGGVIEGVEASLPTGYSLSMSGNASLRYLITRTNPIELETVASPPAPNGMRDVSISKEGQGVGDFVTLRNLSLSGKAGAVSVPPGTYGSFSASGRTTLVLGSENATEPAIYNLQGLTLSGGSDLRLAGPVVLTVGGDVSLSGSSAGAADNPHRLLLKVSGGEVKVSGNGVLYGVVRAPRSAVNISGNGRLRGTVTCDRLSVSGNGVIQVTENDITPPPVNRPPMADAGPDQTITLPADTVSLNGTVSDDGLPQYGTLSVNWKVSSGPGPVSFANQTSAATTAIFTVPGVYVLKLTASDGRLTRSDSVRVEVVQRNQPPTVNAGPDQTIKLSDSANLSGVVTDDALPHGSTVSVKWNASSGPAAVTFADSNVAATSVSFAAPGVYTLKLSADDSEFNVADEVVITVNSSNQPPTVDAGPDQSVTQSSATPAPTEFRLTAISTGFNSPIGIDYHQPTNKVVMSVNYNAGGQPHNFELVAANGTHSRFSNISGLTDELKLATARDDGGGMSLGGFQAGELFTGSGAPGVVVRVSADGSTVQNPWVTLPGEGGLMRGSLHVDRTGVFGGDLIAVTTAGGVWRINSAGQATRLASIPTHLEGLSTIPDIPQKYGPWAGKILIGAENQRRFYTVDARGNTAFFDLDISPEDIDLIPENENFFGVDFGSGRLMGAPASAFRDMVGDLLVAQEFPGTIFRVHWNGTEFEKTALATLYQWEHVTFAPAGIAEVAPVGTTVTLNGTVTDDAAPGFPLSVMWTKVSGPGPVSFDSPTQPVTNATFNQPGTYVLRLTGSDTEFSSRDEVTVVVKPSSPPGRIYTRNADFDEGSFINVTHAVPDQLQLDETTPDQGTWSTVFDSQIAGTEWGHIGWTARVCGDGLLTITVASSEDGASFSQPITVSNGDDPDVPAGRYARVSVKFERASSGESPVLYDLSVGTVGFPLETQTNLAPDVDAGTNQTIEGVTKTTLRGAACDDGLPSNRRLALSWSKVSGPGAVTFARPDSAATEVTFSITGTYELKLTAQDSAFTRSDTVVVEVIPANEPPVADAGPDQSVTHPASAILNGSVTDDGLQRGSTLLATWSKVSGPGSVTFNDPNAASTGARFGAPGIYVLRLTASDSEFARHDDVTVTVGGENQSPVANAGPDQSVRLPNTATLNGTATDDGWPEGSPLAVSWSKVSGPGTVTFANPGVAATTATFSEPGTYVLKLTASDSELTGSATTTVTVNPEVPPPTVEITAPTDGSEVTAPTSIIGSVSNGPWKLEYSLFTEGIPDEAQAWIVFATGSAPVENGPLGTLDPTLLLNGVYAIRLTATNEAGLSRSTSVGVVVSEKMKVGNFSIAFKDIGVPAAGFPIELSRSYDSRDKRPGDFGVGWNLSLSRIRLQKTETLGKSWYQTSSQGIFPVYCLQAIRPHVVTITFPGGKVYKFQATPAPKCQALASLQTTTLSFTPMPGTHGSLAPATGGDIVIVGSVPGPVDFIDLSDLSSDYYNPTLFRLTTEDGTIFLIDQRAGLKSMTDRNGNTLTVGSNGITHSNGQSVSFVRDSQGRIRQIIDPAGHPLAYQYDADGNLDSYTDAEGKVTKYTYTPGHFLRDITITSSDGQRTFRPFSNSYENGRLTEQTDAFGKVTSYDHDLANRRETVTDRRGNQSVLEYDDDGNVLYVRDAEGAETRRTYDGRGNMLTEVTALGTITNVYDDDDNLRQVTDFYGNVTKYTYNAFGQVTSVTDAKNNLTTGTYDPAGNLLSTKDAEGNENRYAYSPVGGLLQSIQQFAAEDPGRPLVMSFDYYPNGHLRSFTDPRGNVTTLTYDSNGNCLSRAMTRTTSSGGRENLTTSFEYDSLNRLVQTVYPDNTFTQAAYNEAGRKSFVKDQLGRETRYEYDAMGRRARTIYPDGLQEEAEYDAEGNIVRSIDRANQQTLNTYDRNGRLTETLYADGERLTQKYDGAGRIIERSRWPDPATKHSTTYRYEADGRSRIMYVTDALNHTSKQVYDEIGNLWKVIDAGNRTTAYEYDRNGQQIKTIYPDGTFVLTTYDGYSRIVSETDQAGKVTRFGYDELGRLVKVVDSLGHETGYAYDEVGNLISQTDANNHTTRLEYDRLGQRVKRTMPEGMSELFTYDAAGNLKTRTDFNGKQTTYDYDAMNRLTAKTPDASFNQPAVTYAYNAVGKRARMADASGTTTYSYDSRHRLSGVTAPAGTLSYSYDKLGNLRSVRSSHANGVSVDYAYDELSRLTAVTDNRLDPAAATTTYTYDGVGNLQSCLYPNGVQTSYTYNALDRPTGISAASAGHVIASYSYTLGADGKRLNSTEMGGRTVTYTYDDASRLTRESVTGGTAAADAGEVSYTYDAVGNRLTRSSSLPVIPSHTLVYDRNDRLATDTYDLNGNTKAAGGVDYQFDWENRLTGVNQGSVTYVYDGDGNRVARTAGGITTRYLIDPNNPTGHAQVVEELSGGSVVRAYTYGLARVSQSQLIGGLRVASFYGHDGHGSTRFLTGGAGVVTDAYTYDAFGNLIARSGTTPNEYLFAGERYDADLGLYYLRARYMNPATGRFHTMDSFEGIQADPPSLHKYLYGHADPVNNVDPSGYYTTGTINEVSTVQKIGATITAIPSATFVTTQVLATGQAAAALSSTNAALTSSLLLAVEVMALAQKGHSKSGKTGGSTSGKTSSSTSGKGDTETDEDEDDEDRNGGSLQVQGNDIKKEPPKLKNYPHLKYAYWKGEGTVSWSWSQPKPLQADEALSNLKDLELAITDNQLKIRAVAFMEANRFIYNAMPVGTGPTSPSFPRNKARYGLDYPGAPRVDIVVQSGLAFVK